MLKLFLSTDGNWEKKIQTTTKPSIGVFKKIELLVIWSAKYTFSLSPWDKIGVLVWSLINCLTDPLDLTHSKNTFVYSLMYFLCKL